MKTLVQTNDRMLAILRVNGFSRKDAVMVTEAFTSVDVPGYREKDLQGLALRMVKWSVGIQLAQTAVMTGAVLGLLRLYLG